MPDPTPSYLNRELSWIEFNHRVLEEAQDASSPLLERVKFLAITSSNFDEFFMVRVGSLEALRAQGVADPDVTGRTPVQQLAEISARCQAFVAEQHRLFSAELEPRLREAGIRRARRDNLTAALTDHLENVFEHQLYPVLTPVAVEGADDLPSLPGLGLNLLVRLKGEGESKKPRYAVVVIPRKLGRFITLPIDEGHNYLPIEEVAMEFIQRLFPGEPVTEVAPFRITRNADMGVREDLAGDLLAEMKQVLTARKHSDCVRLEVPSSISKTALAFLQATLGARDEFVFSVPGPLDFSSWMGLSRMTGFDHLRDKPWPPQPTPAIRPGETMFQTLARGDLLLYHPYESFDPVVRLLEEAADDPDVLAIKQILYRTSEKSPIVAALARAANRDKHVTALVELKARFDEARNIGWAEALEQSGVQVIYGLKGLKTHAKICIIVRREPTGIRRYVHYGTGNYNELTARMYTDVSYLTAQEDYGADATAFFNMISGYSQPVPFRKIEAAPIGLRARLLELIESEIQRRQQGQPARIRAKLNSLVDRGLIEALYRASQAGVQVELNVRGVCALRPGVPGLSENIRVVSIVDRFLEHPRIIYVHHGGSPRLFISSADWMPRNLDRRVELLVEVDEDACRRRLVEILDTCFADTAKARLLQPDGTHVRVKPGRDPLRSQEVFFRQACEAVRVAEKQAGVVFEPQRPTAKP